MVTQKNHRDRLTTSSQRRTSSSSFSFSTRRMRVSPLLCSSAAFLLLKNQSNRNCHACFDVEWLRQWVDWLRCWVKLGCVTKTSGTLGDTMRGKNNTSRNGKMGILDRYLPGPHYTKRRVLACERADQTGQLSLASILSLNLDSNLITKQEALALTRGLELDEPEPLPHTRGVPSLATLLESSQLLEEFHLNGKKAVQSIQQT